MSELFRSALSYLGGAGAGPGGVARADHDLVGSHVEVGGLKLRITRLIAEGGFGLVFAAADSSNREYALKRLLAADREAAEGILMEIRFLRLLTGHPNIIRYVQAASLSPQESGHGRAEYLVLTELCSGGPVVDALRTKKLTPEHVLKIFHATCEAVKHMHLQEPPITHRDLKVENLLLDQEGFVKLCDFGSATTETFEPGPSWTAAQRSATEDEMARHTTPMYRAPELLDLWLDYPIGPASDVWALGCLLYYLSYRSHPFEDSAKLRILNANYTLPEHETPFTCFHPLIEGTLVIDPRKRVGIIDLCESVEALATALCVDLKAPLVDLLPAGVANKRPPPPRPPPAPRTASPSPSDPPPPQPNMEHMRQSPAPSDPHAGGGLFGSIRGSAGSLFKNLKDTSSKVVQSVHQSVSGKGPDFTYITSRLGIAPTQDSIPEPIAGQLEEQLRAFLEQRHREQFAVYNLGHRKLKSNFGGRLSEVPLSPSVHLPGRPPTLNSLFLICKNMALWLRQDQSNICVLTGPEQYCVLMSSAFLIFSRLAQSAEQALELIASRRSRQTLPPSFLRYLDYTGRLSSLAPELGPNARHNRAATLHGLHVEPLPLFNRARMGCRPFIEVWVGGDRALSTSQEYEKLRPFEYPETLELPLGVTVCGDVTLALFHARSTLGAKVQGRFSSIPIFRVSFHTGLVAPGTTALEFQLRELDETDEDPAKYQRNFRVTIDLKLSDKDRPFDEEPPAYWVHDPKSASSRLLVGGKEEKDAILRSLGLPKTSPEITPTKEPVKEPGDFLSSLNWEAGSTKPFTDDSPANSRDPSRSPLPQRPPPVKKTSEPLFDDAEAAEREAGIRVSTGPFPPEEEDEEILNEPPGVPEADLLNFGADFSAQPPPAARQQPAPFDPFAEFTQSTQNGDSKTTTNDPFASFANGPSTAPPPAEKADVNLLGDWLSEIPISSTQQHMPPPTNNFPKQQRSAANSPMGTPMDGFGGLRAPQMMHRNASTPAFTPSAGFVPPQMGGAQWRPPPPGNMGAPLRPPMGANRSGATTPILNRPNYSRSNFEVQGGVGVKPKVNANAFDDILSSQGFEKKADPGSQTIGELRRKEDIRDMSPNDIKVRDWIAGKERNIRALLGTLSVVTWEGCRWKQIPMGELLTPVQIKKQYRLACLAVHPDKQTGSENESLAKAVFTELNDAYTEYVNQGEPSF